MRKESSITLGFALLFPPLRKLAFPPCTLFFGKVLRHYLWDMSLKSLCDLGVGVLQLGHHPNRELLNRMGWLSTVMEQNS